jgi:hypothetical protein
MNEFKFNDATQALIYEMYHNENRELDSHSTHVKKNKIFLKRLLQVSQNTQLIQSDFNWGPLSNNYDLSNYHDLNLLLIYYGLSSSFNVLWGRQDNDLVKFGLLKIWFKTLQTDPKINGDLRNALTDNYSFQPNPNDMYQHMEAVEKEISINYFANKLYPQN